MHEYAFINDTCVESSDQRSVAALPNSLMKIILGKTTRLKHIKLVTLSVNETECRRRLKQFLQNVVTVRGMSMLYGYVSKTVEV